MGRNRGKKKNKSQNVVFTDDVVNNVSSNVATDDGFTSVKKEKKPMSYANIAEKLSNSNTNTHNSSLKRRNSNINKNVVIDIDYKRMYVDGFLQNYWSIVNRYHKINDIIIEPDSDDEELIYDEY